MVKAVYAGIVVCLLGGYVAIHEWAYHQSHRYRPGPSAELSLIGVALIVIGLAIAYIANYIIEVAELRAAQETAAYFASLSSPTDDEQP